MKVAVTYENGEIFQHFGHSENFKVYEIADGKVVASEVIATNGSGHGALAGLLSGEGISALICGGIGPGAQNALMEAGIELYSGVSGDADEAVEAYLNGELLPGGSNCDHHGEGHSCGHQEEGAGCGGGCSSCHSAPSITGENVGKTVRVHYKGTFNDGTQFDASYDRGEPLEFVCGAGMMIPGFDQAVANMALGESVDIHLMPEEAYGMPDLSAIFTMPVAQMPGAEKLSGGERVYLYDQLGRPIPALVVLMDGENITFDTNHEMAGKELNFHIELVEIL